MIAEHVYEAQLIGRFFRWLVDGRMPAGYTNPSHQWVDEVLLGLGPTSRIVKEPEWVEDNLWLLVEVVMRQGVFLCPLITVNW